MYYVGTQSYPSLYEAIAAASATGGTVSAQPVGTTSTDGGMLSGSSTTSTYTFDREQAYQDADDERQSTVQAGIEERYAAERAERLAREQASGQKEYIYASARDLDEGQERPLAGFTEVKTAVGHAGLRELYNSKGQYEDTFGSADNFIEYMDSMHELQQSDPNLYNWWETPTFEEWKNLNYSPQDLRQMYYEGSTRGASVDSVSVDEQLQREYASWKTTEHKSSFSDFDGDAAYQQLLLDHDVQTVTYNSDGDMYQWNGSFPVKMVETGVGEFGLRDFMEIVATTALTAGVGSVLSTSMQLGNLASATLSSIVTQGITTGEIDPSKVLQAAATAGLTGAISEIVSGVSPEYLDALSTGNEAVDNVLATMAMDVVKQGVIEGQIDFQQVFQSGMFTAASELIGFLQGNMAVDPAKQAEFEAKWAEMTAEQHQEMFSTIEQTFGSGALTEALNSMDAQTAMMASQTLSDMFAANNVTVSQGSDGTWVEEQEVDLTDDTTADSIEQPIYDTPPAQINNPFEGDQLINGVYYNEAGFPVGVHPDATADQILEQFVNDKNAWNTLAGSAHGLPPEAVAILVEAGGGTVQGLSDLLVANGLILAQGEGGQYVIISGSNSTTGLHTSLNQDALLELQAPTENNYMPNPQPTNDLLNPTDTSDVSQEMLDILTNVEQQPDIMEPDMSIEPTTVEPDPITPDPIDIVDPVEPPVTTDPTDTTSGDAGATGDAGAGTGITVSDVTTAVNEAINALPASATPQDVQEAIDAAVATIEVPSGMTSAEVQEIVDGAVAGIVIPEGVTAEEMETAISGAVTGLASTADVTVAVDDAVTTLQEQIAALPTGATATEVQTAIDTAIAGIEFPAGLTTEDVQSVVDTAISGITFPESVTADQMSSAISTAVSGLATQADITAAIAGITFPEGISTQDVQGIVDTAIAGIEFPAGLSSADVSSIVDTAIAGIEFPAGLSTDDVRAEIDAALTGVATTQSVQDAISTAIGGLNNLSSTDVQSVVDTAIAGIEFPAGLSAEDVQSIVDTAVSGIQFPEGISTADVQSVVDAALTGLATQADVSTAISNAVTGLEQTMANLPFGASAEDVQTAIDTAIVGIQFPESVTNQQMTDALANAIDSIEFPQGLTEADVTTIVNTALEGVATTREMNDAINVAVKGLNQAIADIPEGLTALEVSDVVNDAIDSIQFPESVTDAQMTTAISNAIAGIVFPEGLTAADVAEVVSNSGFATPENVATAIANAGYVTPEDLGTALSTAGFSTPQDVADAIAAAGFSTPEDVNAAIANAGFTTPEDVAAAVAAAGFSTSENIAASEDRMTTLFNQGLESVGGDINALAQQSLDQYGSLQDTLASQAAGQAEALTDTEARLLENMTGIESSVLQELSTVQGGLESALSDVGMDIEGLAGDVDSRIGDVETAMSSGFAGVADQFGQVQGDLAGLGAGIAGLGSGLAGIGSGLLSGLGQLGAGQQGLQQKISAPKWEDFYTGDITAGRRDFQSQYIGQPQQSNTVDNLNQMIARSLEMSPSTQGMFGNFQNKG